MKKVFFFVILMTAASLIHSQGLKGKLTSLKGGKQKTGKVVAAPEGDYSDPSGISGTYYPTTTMKYADTKSTVGEVKINFDGNHKLEMYSKKGDTPDVFYMEDWMEFARDNYNLSQFKVRVGSKYYHVMTVEPGVLIFGAFTHAPKDMPGRKDKQMVADTDLIEPIVLVKDPAVADKYSQSEAIRIMGERGTVSEVSNVLRIANKTPLPSIGKMNEDKKLIETSIALVKAKWAEFNEVPNIVGAYIYNDEWGEVQYGKVIDPGETLFSDEVAAIMLFQNPGSGLCYYHSVGISRKAAHLTVDGFSYDNHLQMTGTSTIQYITKEKLDAQLKLLGN